MGLLNGISFVLKAGSSGIQDGSNHELFKTESLKYACLHIYTHTLTLTPSLIPDMSVVVQVEGT